jgi:hypothetical protein
MDDTKTLNPSLGGSPGDLWKKVLDEVQSDAAARRSKAAARSVAGDKRGGLEVDLLKRILTAIETRRESDPRIKILEQRTEQVLAAVASVPRADTSPQLAALQQQVRDLTQRVAELAAREDQKQPDPAMIDALDKVRAEMRGIPKPADPAPKLGEIAQAVAAAAAASQQSQQELLQQITQHIAAIPRPADLSPQLQALEAAVAASSAARHDAILSQIEAAVQRQPDAAPQPIDHTAELNAILVAVSSMPTVDPDGLANRIVEAIERIKPVDPSDLLNQLRADVQALPRPVDATAKLDALLHVVRASPVTEQLQQLQAAIAALPTPIDATAKLDAIVAAIETSPVGAQIEELRSEIAAIPRPVDVSAKLDVILASLSSVAVAPVTEQVQQLRSEIAALPKPVDASAKLDALLETVRALPTLDATALMGQLRAEIQASPRPADPGAKLDELLALARKPIDDGRDEVLLQILESVQKPEPVYHERFDTLLVKLDALAAKPVSDSVTPAMIERVNASLAALPDAAGIAEQVRTALAGLPRPVDVAPQLASILSAVTELTARPHSPAVDVDAAVQRAVAEALKGQAQVLEQVRAELASLREGVRQEMTSQTAGLRNELASHTNEVISQVRAQSQSLREDVSRSASRLREEMHTTGPAAKAAAAVANDDALKSVVAKLRGNPVLVRQEELLQRLAAASRANPAHNPDITRQMLTELPRLAEWDAATTRAVEEQVASFGEDQFADGGGPSPTWAGSGGSGGGYSWMARTPPKSKAVPIAIGVAALVALGVVLFLVINALSGPPASANGSPAKPGDRAATNDAGGKTEGPKPGTDLARNAIASAPGAPSTPAAPVTPVTTATKDAPATENKAPFELFPKSPVKADAAAAPATIINELRNIADGVADKSRIHDIPQARQIVFLVHNNTVSATTLAASVAEVKRLLAKVGPGQKFTVVFSEGKRFVEAPPHGLREGGDKEKAAMAAWIDANIRPAERPAANPLVAMDLAFSYAPDLLWIVSDGLAGEGAGQVPPKEIMARAAELNPKGQTRIAATQVGPADAAGTLKALAQQHGGIYGETDGPAAPQGK